MHQRLQHLEQLVRLQRVPGRKVEVKQVDVVALQASQALLAGAADVGRGEVLRGLRVRLQERGGIEVVARFGGDDDAAAPPTERPGEQLLAVAAAVDVRRVEEGDAQVDGLVQQREAFALVAPGRPGRDERPNIQSNGGNLYSGVCYAAVSHDVCLRAMCGQSL